MATSGSVDFQSIAGDLIRDGLGLLGYIGSDEAVQNADNTLCLRMINRVLKHWQTVGIDTYALEYLTLVPTANTSEYTISPTGANATTNLSITEVSTAVSATDTILVVDSTSGMSVSDNIGIELDNNTIQWTTISSVDSGTQVTVNDAISSASSVDNNIYFYTSKANRPLDVVSVRYSNDDDNDTPVNKISRDDYDRISNKNTKGQPVNFFYDKEYGQNVLKIYPIPATMDGTLKLTVISETEDIDATSDNFDLPKVAELALQYGFAFYAGPIFERPETALKLKQTYFELLDDLLAYMDENSSFIVRTRSGFQK